MFANGWAYGDEAEAFDEVREWGRMLGDGERVVWATWKGGAERVRGWSNDGARSIDGREVGGCMCTAVAMVLRVSDGRGLGATLTKLTRMGTRVNDIRSSGSVQPASSICKRPLTIQLF